MHCKGNFKLRSHNTSYCLIEVVTNTGLTVHVPVRPYICLIQFMCNNQMIDFYLDV
jgi:hypothetical protein